MPSLIRCFLLTVSTLAATVRPRALQCMRSSDLSANNCSRSSKIETCGHYIKNHILNWGQEKGWLLIIHVPLCPNMMVALKNDENGYQQMTINRESPILSICGLNTYM